MERDSGTTYTTGDNSSTISGTIVQTIDDSNSATDSFAEVKGHVLVQYTICRRQYEEAEECYLEKEPEKYIIEDEDAEDQIDLDISREPP